MSTSQSLQRTVYIGTFVHTPLLKELDIKHDTALGVDENGRISFIEPCKDSAEIATIAAKHGWDSSSFTVINPAATSSTSSSKYQTTFFFPGLVDTHTHASQYPNVGVFGNSTLLDWLNTYTFPLEASFSSISRATAVYARAVQRSLANGTTAAAYYATVHVPATNLLADICRKRGQRALVGRVCMDRLSPDYYRDESTAAAVKATEDCIAHCLAIDPHGDIVRPVITPRFAPSCTDETLAALGALHQSTGHMAQTHISENHAEIDLVKSQFPNSKHYTDVYDTAGLLTERTILAHAVHLSPDEVTLIHERRACISHCPASNTCLTSGAAGVRGLLNTGVRVGLGTDVSGGYSSSVLEMARQALLVSRHVAMGGDKSAKLDLTEALWLATRGGADVLGLGDRVGAFEVGMEWDAQLVQLGACVEEDGDVELRGEDLPVDVFGWEPWEDRVAKWLYGGDDRNVRAVWVRGREVHRR